MRTIAPPTRVRRLLSFCLLSGLILGLVLLAACAAQGPRPGQLPQGIAWPPDPNAGRVFYQPSPLADTAQAMAALQALAPKLAVPDSLESWVEFHRTKDVLVAALHWTQWEYRDMEVRSPLCFDSAFNDCVQWRNVRVKAAKDKRLAVGPGEVLGIRVMDDDSVVLATAAGSLTLAAPDRGAALDLADAYYTLASGSGYHQEPGPAAIYRDLDPREAAALNTAEHPVTGGVLVISAPQGTSLAQAGLKHLDVVLALDGAPASAGALQHALAKTRSSAQATILRWTELDSRPWLEARVYTIPLP